MTYLIDSIGYYQRGRRNFELYKRNKIVDHLIYAALEYRMCIERILFEYLIVMRTKNLSKSMEKLYRIHDLRKAILTLEPDFILKIDFTNLCMQAADLPGEIQVPDLNKLDQLYGRLGNYLHAPKKPHKTSADQNWWEKLFNLIIEVECYAGLLLVNPIGAMKLNAQGLTLFQQYRSGQISKKELREKICASRHSP